jgi:hypothetical protein
MRDVLADLETATRRARDTLGSLHQYAPRLPRRVRSPSPAQSTIAVAAGALAIGALAIGALAIGRLAIQRMVIRRARIQRLEVDELVVGKLHIREQTGPETSDTD